MLPHRHCVGPYDLIAEGDRVVHIAAGVANVFRIADGKIVEHLTFATELDTLRQLGAPLHEAWLALMHGAPEMELRAT